MLPFIIRRSLLIIPNVILLTALLFWGVTALLGSPAAMMRLHTEFLRERPAGVPSHPRPSGAARAAL